MVQLDKTNLRLLELLQRDARICVIDLARAVDRAESTVRERVASMERDGILQGYRALVDPNKLGFRAHAFVRTDCDRRKVPDLAKRLAAIPQVVSAVLTMGRRPLVIEIMAESPAVLEQVLEERIAPLEVSAMVTDFAVKTLVEPRPIPLTTLLANGGLPEQNGDARKTTVEALLEHRPLRHSVPWSPASVSR